MELTVIDNAAKRRFEMHADGQLAAFSQYRLDEPGVYAFTHTQTQPAFAGHGLATALIHEALGRIRAAGNTALPYCPFVNSYIRKHPEDADLVPLSERHRFGIPE
jgi:predicted GNAT family acetyltransferase